jgi:hypothetical protein
MSKITARFGELSIRTASSLDDDNIEGDERFSTIDLSGSQNGEINKIDFNHTDEGNDSMLNGSMNGYTSFGESQNTNYMPQKNANFPLTPNSSTNAASNSTTYDHLHGSSYPSDSVSNQNLKFHSAPKISANYAVPEATKIGIKATQNGPLETFKEWSKSAYKCTKQIVSEKLGKTQRTIDPELEATINHLRELKKKYENILGLSNSLSLYFTNIVTTQRQLGDSFADLATKSPELIEEFNANAQTQRNLARHADTLIRGINQFVASLNTLCTKTIEDTLITIRNYEASRLEYDANRIELEHLKSSPQYEQKIQKVNILEQDISAYREKYEKLKSDVSIKMRFLDENRVKVMKKQLVLFHSSIAAFFTGNQSELEAQIKQLDLNQQKSQNILTPDEHKFESFLAEN